MRILKRRKNARIQKGLAQARFKLMKDRQALEEFPPLIQKGIKLYEFVAVRNMVLLSVLAGFTLFILFYAASRHIPFIEIMSSFAIIAWGFVLFVLALIFIFFSAYILPVWGASELYNKHDVSKFAAFVLTYFPFVILVFVLCYVDYLSREGKEYLQIIFGFILLCVFFLTWGFHLLNNFNKWKKWIASFVGALTCVGFIIALWISLQLLINAPRLLSNIERQLGFDILAEWGGSIVAGILLLIFLLPGFAVLIRPFSDGWDMVRRGGILIAIVVFVFVAPYPLMDGALRLMNAGGDIPKRLTLPRDIACSQDLQKFYFDNCMKEKVSPTVSTNVRLRFMSSTHLYIVTNDQQNGMLESSSSNFWKLKKFQPPIEIARRNIISIGPEK